MPFVKGEAPGRPVGAKNKVTILVKDAFAQAFSELQDDDDVRLSAWGKQNPTEFYKLASKLIPIQLAGDPDNPISFTLKGALGFEDDKHQDISIRMSDDITKPEV